MRVIPGLQKEGREGLLFLKKKKQKDFHPLVFARPHRGTTPSGQKFFGSFFQKRTTLSPPEARMSLPSHTRVAVIGGGVVGCSVLFHLAKAGWKDICLIERLELTAGSSWHAAGGFHTLNGDPNVAKLQSYTVQLYKEIEEISGQSCGLHITGGMMLAGTPERMDFLKLAHAKGRYLGMDTEIIDAAEAVYADVGWDAATIDQVAKKARLSRALVYVYFKDKQDLHLAIVERALDDLHRRFVEAAREPATGLAKVEAIGLAYVEYSRDVPHYFDACSQYQAYQAEGVTERESNEEGCLTASRLVHGVLVEALQTGMQDGSIRPDVGDPLTTAIALWGFAHGIIQLAATKADMLGQFGIETEPLIRHGFALMTASLVNRR